MKYIISTAKSETVTNWTPSEFRKHYLRWTPREIFEQVTAEADPAGTWQEWLVTNDKDEAAAEMDRIKKSPWELIKFFIHNECLGLSMTVFKLESDNEDEDDPCRISLIEFIAGEYEHEIEPEDEPDHEEEPEDDEF